ncbi:hypothetical protein AGMMS49587_02450 [Spirochaetia bacterium]|nr:hypothetical protein AGMMS49587_02450 [Spirochaetia bacterium]
MGTEIQNIEKTLGTPALGGPRRHEALVHLARLYELSGNIEGAAQAWTNAASADPVNRDDLALIRGAACYAAMGEWEKAESAVKTVLLTGWDKQTLLRARLLALQIGAFRSGQSAGNADGVAALGVLLDESDYGEFKASICYTLWKITGADTWKTRLITEFPRSPEARIAAGSGEISATPTAMWLLIPGRESIATAPAAAPSAPAVPVATVPSASAAAPVAAPVAPAPSAATAPAAAGTGAANGAVLQTGLFGREANAQVMAERLKKAGFTPAISRRSVNGADYWVVSVPAGSDINATILRLKNAGVESFPVFN